MDEIKTGLFSISLDFELHWGVISRLTVKEYQKNLDGTRHAIDEMLRLFEKYEIHVTWATVGFLFSKDYSELLKHSPQFKPNYNNSKYSSYSYLDSIGQDEKSDPYHFAPYVIDKIRRVPHQEIASHTFSHYFCLEAGQSIKEFEADLIAFKNISLENGINVESIVFPRNQYSKEYIEVCIKHGVHNFRGNPTGLIYRPRKRDTEHLHVKAMRVLDTYYKISGNNTYSIKKEHGALNIPASRFLRPYNKLTKLLEPIRFSRIVSEMELAAQQNKLYHLWWHPHNFGMNTKENIYFLEKILKKFQFLSQQHGMKSMNMGEIGKLFNETR